MRLARSTIVACILSAACATGQEKKGSDTTAAAAPPAPAPSVLTVTATDFAFDAPESVPAGTTTIRMVNNGRGIHHVQVLQLLEGKTYADLEAAFKAMTPASTMPGWIRFIGGPLPVAPGAPSDATVPLDAGNYALVCLVDIPDHVPHFAKGMMRPLMVTSPAVAVTPPAADVNVTLSDYAFAASPALSAGKHVLHVTNTAKQPHEIFLLRLDAGKTMQDMAKWATDFKGPPPGTPMGGTAAISPGVAVDVPVDLTAGEYILICFVSDAKDGKAHVAHGMVQQITVGGA
jgi:uncharacterized cupredoxin-like copper-binding protein